MNENSHFYIAALDNISDGVYFVDWQNTITFWNKGAERITGYTAEEVTGRMCKSDILMHMNEQGEKLCAGMCPLTKTLKDGHIREERVFLCHKSGHRIPVLTRFIPVRDQSNYIIGAMEVFQDLSSMIAEAAKLKSLAKTAYVDPVTTLVNRQYVENKLGQLLQELPKGSQPFGVLLLNINQFKMLNDKYGNRIGDELLKLLAKAFLGNVVPTDTVGRWLGAKYIIVSQNTNKSLLLMLANKLKTLAENSGLKTNDTVIKVNISISGTMALASDTVDTLVERAEKIMAYNLVRIQ